MRTCPTCGHENSDKTYKCYECGALFYTDEEMEATFPPGRGGWDWFSDDAAENYRVEVGKEWSPDPELHGRDAWIAPDGTFWPCGPEQHPHLAPVLVAQYDLYGKPRCRGHEGVGGGVATDDDGIYYYTFPLRYPDSKDILMENGFLSLGHPAFKWGKFALYNTGYLNEDVTPEQHKTIARWREINKVDYIHYYDEYRAEEEE